MTDNTKQKAAERRLAAFRAKLDTLSTEEIRADLDARRIRSGERRALAEEIIADRVADEEAPVIVTPTRDRLPVKLEQPSDKTPEPSAARRFGKVLGMALSLTAFAWAIVRLVRR